MNDSRASSNFRHGGMIMPAGWIGERVDGIALNPSRRGRQDGRTHPIRLRLLTWQLTAFLGSTVAAAACLLGDCPFGEKARPRTTLVDQAGCGPIGRVRAGRDAAGDGRRRRFARAPGPGGRDGDIGCGRRAPTRFAAWRSAPTARCWRRRAGPPSSHCTISTRSGRRPSTMRPRRPPAPRAWRSRPTGATLAVGQQDGRITLWDVVTGRFRSVLDGHADFVASLAFAPDGTTLASAGGDRTVRVWDLSAGRERLEIRGQASTFVALSFSPDGRLLALADQVSPDHPALGCRHRDRARGLARPGGRGRRAGDQPRRQDPGRGRLPGTGHRLGPRDLETPPDPDETRRGLLAGLRPRRPHPGLRRFRRHRPPLGLAALGLGPRMM